MPRQQEVWSFAYDVSGLRIAVIRTGSRTFYAYDQQWQLLGEYREVSGVLTPTAEYIWMDGLPIAVVRPKAGSAPTAPNSEQEVFFLHPDHLGAPRVAVDMNGQLRWRWMGGEPFGVLPPEDNPSNLGPLYVGLRFPGQVADGLVGLHYNVFRDYDASVGRYAQSDPIGLGGGINTYGYTEGNPTNKIDPDGRFPLLVIPGLCAGGGCEALIATIALASPSGQKAIKDTARAVSDFCAAKEIGVEQKCQPATPANIQSVLATSSMQTLQPSVSASHVQSLVNILQAGGTLPPIQVDGNVIVDGNHRYAAGLLCGMPAAIQPWTAPLTRPRMPVRSLKVLP